MFFEWVATGDFLRFKKELKGEPIVEIMAARSAKYPVEPRDSQKVHEDSRRHRGRLRPVWRDEALAALLNASRQSLEDLEACPKLSKT